MENLNSYYLSFIAGLISFFSPCILPLFPIYLTTLNNTNNDSKIFYQSIIFVFSFCSVFILLGLTATSLGIFLNVNKLSLLKISGSLIVLFGLFNIFLNRFTVLNKNFTIINSSSAKPLIKRFLLKKWHNSTVATTFVKPGIGLKIKSQEAKAPRTLSKKALFANQALLISMATIQTQTAQTTQLRLKKEAAQTTCLFNRLMKPHLSRKASRSSLAKNGAFSWFTATQKPESTTIILKQIRSYSYIKAILETHKATKRYTSDFGRQLT